MDSGASHTIVNDPKLFSEFYRDSEVSIIVADKSKGKSKARWGKLLPNCLGLESAIYLPDLGPQGLLSCAHLEDIGINSDLGSRMLWRNWFVWTVYRENRLYFVDILFESNENWNKISQNQIENNPKSYVSVSETVVSPLDFDAQAPSSLEENPKYAKMTKKDRLREHERHGHFHLPGLSIDFCPACSIMKGRSDGHAQVRPEYLVPTYENEQVDCDFVGPFPQSMLGNVWLLVMVETFLRWPEVFPCKTRGECGQKLKTYCSIKGRPTRVRTDNGKEFKEPGSSWKKVCSELNIIPTFSPQYHPAMNGVVERMNQTLQAAIRACIQFVDKRLWDHAALYVAYNWARTARKDGESPYSRKHGRKPPDKHLRTFGCLCFCKDHSHTTKLQEKFLPAVFLGYSRENSTYMVGRYAPDLRASAGESWRIEEYRDVKLNEDFLIRDVDMLKKDNLDRLLKQARDEGCGVGAASGMVAPGGDGLPASDAPAAPGPSDPLPNLTGSEVEVESKDTTQEVQPQLDVVPPSPPASLDKSLKRKREDEEEVPDENRIVTENSNGDVVVKKKRGRPKGLTKQPHWKKQGRKKKTENANYMSDETAANEVCRMLLVQLDDKIEKIWRKQRDIESEVAVAYSIQMTHAKILKDPDSAKYIEAGNLERTQLEALSCWRPIKPGEIKDSDEVLPSVVIYTRKRDGRSKARLVALGNKQTNVLAGEVYSPTISHAANRVMLVDSASKGCFLESFDISNAFTQSLLNVDDDDPESDRVFMRLPPHWCAQNRGQIVRLLKSLYGLRISPRRWFDTYASYLRESGWEMNPTEPGLWRRGNLMLSIYVDDTLLSGPVESEVVAARNEILNRFPGKLIPPERSGKWQVWDVLGARVKYCREERELEIDMERSIDKLLQKFNMNSCRTVSSPCCAGDIAALGEGKENTTFPTRSLLGALQHIANVARPDIASAVNRVARHVSPKCTDRTVKACKRILQYLKGSKTRGLHYSPENERNFRMKYEVLLTKNKTAEPLGDAVSFADSDFAGCTLTFRSTSGSIMYYKGMPVAWRSSRQTLRAHSTCEAEYNAIYDTIRLTQGQGYLDWFIENKELPTIFSDNQSALAVAGSSVPTKKSKHFMLRYMLVRDHFKSLCYVPTDINQADPLTKTVTAKKYVDIFTSIPYELDDEFEEEMDLNASCNACWSPCFASTEEIEINFALHCLE